MNSIGTGYIKEQSLGLYNSYIKFSTGLIVQWGYLPSASDNHVTFLTSFSNSYYFAGAFLIRNSSSGDGHGYSYNRTTTDCYFETIANATYLVVGY